jgi:hypothetical protein
MPEARPALSGCVCLQGSEMLQPGHRDGLQRPAVGQRSHIQLAETCAPVQPNGSQPALFKPVAFRIWARLLTAQTVLLRGRTSFFSAPRFRSRSHHDRSSLLRWPTAANPLISSRDEQPRSESSRSCTHASNPSRLHKSKLKERSKWRRRPAKITQGGGFCPFHTANTSRAVHVTLP